ncbi:MAG: hypothetical protein JJU05_09820 [Verrucomicrobia bacterium]|nr:hypothetical protein [Verrucomicrobiota bacterium]MCH8527554.1 hypothetical protein [Kiritimatiellia bacterium]
MPANAPFVYASELTSSDRYRVRLDGVEHFVMPSERAHVVRAQGAGPVQVEIECAEEVQECVVRPLALGVESRGEGRVVRFTLNAPARITLEINGEVLGGLFLFLDAESAVPSPAETTHFFKAGVIHEAGCVSLMSGARVYLEGGAVVRGQFHMENAEDVRIWGPGILDQRARDHRVNTLYVRKSRRIEIEDILLLDTLDWSVHLSFSSGVSIRGIAIFGWRANCDGIDVLSSSRVHIRDCFIRTDDDCVAIKAGKWDPDPDGVLEDVLVEGCTFWNHVPGNAIEFGFELDNRLIRKVVFRDCDVLRVLSGAVFSVHNAGRSRVENILIENIRVEDARDELIDLYIGMSIYSPDRPPEHFPDDGKRYWTPPERQDMISPDNAIQWWPPMNEAERLAFAPGRGHISNIRIRDIHMQGPPLPIVIKGFDKDHRITNVDIECIYSRGERIDIYPAENFRIVNAGDLRYEQQLIETGDSV